VNVSHLAAAVPGLPRRPWDLFAHEARPYARLQRCDKITNLFIEISIVQEVACFAGAHFLCAGEGNFVSTKCLDKLPSPRDPRLPRADSITRTESAPPFEATLGGALMLGSGH